MHAKTTLSSPVRLAATSIQSIGQVRGKKGIYNFSISARSASIPWAPSIFPLTWGNEFWSYQEQYTSSKLRPVLRYTKNYEFANWLVTTLKGQVLGLDLEWKSEGPVNVCLVQICDEKSILLIHLSAMEC
jgi:hypothetical protein